MLNQLRSDYFKLLHSRLIWVIGMIVAGFLLLFVLLAFNNAVFSMGAVQGYHNGQPVLNGFEGFLGLSYRDPAHPLFWELAYASTAFTGMLWIVFMALSVQYVSMEFQSGTIRLSVSYGMGKFRIYFSKWIVVISYLGILFYLFNLAAFGVLAGVKGFYPSFTNILSLIKLVSLYYLVYLVFALICFTLYLLTKNTLTVSTLMIVLMFSLYFVIAAAGEHPSSLVVRAYLLINPLYYLCRASGFWVNAAIVREIMWFTVFGLSSLFLTSYLLLRRMELK